MIIDTHCHIDLYEEPENLLKECERKNICVLAMTNLPSHFEMGLSFFRQSKYTRLSLGLHPLYAEKHESEYHIFLRNIDKTSYIGEVGLDFSREGIITKDLQVNSFTNVLENISNKKKILSIHSRRAEKEVLELLINHNIKNAIFHWYSGSISLIKNILDAGYFFSINPAMISTPNGQTIISKIPINKILTESDGPFVKLNNEIIHPIDVKAVLNYISSSRNINISEVENQIQKNFYELINRIR